MSDAATASLAAVIRQPELIFGLVSAAGTDSATIVAALSDELKSLGYAPHSIVVSDLIADLPKYSHLLMLRSGPEDERINKSMDAGNDLRETLQSGAAAMYLAIGKIRELRESLGGNSDKRLSSTAFIIKSLKNPAETALLRRIYGDSFIQLSVYEPKHIRIENLARRIAKSCGRFETGPFEGKAKAIVERDEREKGKTLGQNVSDVFPLADFFLSKGMQSREQIQRFLHIQFSSPFRTPTVDEYGMFHAFAASRRSADLSRQVGAVVTTPSGELICSGCNEVARAGGGSIWESIPPAEQDYRDFKLGEDASASMKREIVRDAFEALKQAGWLSETKSAVDAGDLTEQSLNPIDGPLRGRRVSDIIEYGRIVHAEMSALMDAVRRGISVGGTTLYCTTFPCHMCARHLIAAGLKRVVYIEPYPKSMAKQLYKRAIRVDNDAEADCDALRFEPFVGVAPVRYLELFEKPKRKDDAGYAVPDQPSREPRIKNTVEQASDLELTSVDELNKLL